MMPSRLASVAGLLVALGVMAAHAETAAKLYLLHCSGCHGTDGVGSRIGRVPPFPEMIGPIARAAGGRAYLVHVPGMADAALSDGDTAEVLNYVLAEWAAGRADTDVAPYSAQEVHDIRKQRIDDIIALRKKIAAELLLRGISIAY